MYSIDKKIVFLYDIVIKKPTSSPFYKYEESKTRNVLYRCLFYIWMAVVTNLFADTCNLYFHRGSLNRSRTRQESIIANESGIPEDQKAWRGGRLLSREKISGIWYLGVSSPLGRLTCNDTPQVAVGSLAGAGMSWLAGPLLNVRHPLVPRPPSWSLAF